MEGGLQRSIRRTLIRWVKSMSSPWVKSMLSLWVRNTPAALMSRGSRFREKFLSTGFLALAVVVFLVGHSMVTWYPFGGFITFPDRDYRSRHFRLKEWPSRHEAVLLLTRVATPSGHGHHSSEIGLFMVGCGWFELDDLLVPTVGNPVLTQSCRIDPSFSTTRIQCIVCTLPCLLGSLFSEYFHQASLQGG